MRRRIGTTVIALAAALGIATAPVPADQVQEKLLLDNARVTVYEFVFPPGFRGEEHAAVADEFAYVLAGELTVLTQGRGRRVVRPGEIEFAAEGTVHRSLNETARPARVLVVLLKGR